MAQQVAKVVVFIVLLFSFGYSHAQATQARSYFTPMERVVFEDDFANDATGAFPAKWDPGPSENGISPRAWFRVERNERGTFLSAGPAGYQRENCSVEPHMHDLAYLPDSFTLELDFFLENPGASIDVDFYSSSVEDPFKLIFHTVVKKAPKKGYMFEYCRWYRSYAKEELKLPATFTANAWHHLALSFINKKLDCYLDDNRILAMPGSDYSATAFFISFITPVAIKNVSLNTGKDKSATIAKVPPAAPKPIPATATNPLNKIITEKRFVTHAINFDVNKSEIKPESMGFVGQLATFLKTNPTIRLEIDGHTDNDGDDEKNLKLSKDRAEEVKKQLMLLGISGSRLIARGYGATKPLKPNTTPEGKAENRRVEFVKL